MTDGMRSGSSLHGFLREWVGLDVRSLALMRMGLGAIILLDLGIRARFVEAFYSDAGMLHRSVVAEYSFSAPLELHALGGSAGFELCLFWAAAVCALLLLVGRFTRAATIGCYALTASLHYRNPFILFGFDHILRITLFWSMFLPLGERWSLDARRETRAPGPTDHVSMASAALLVQVVLIYFMAGLAKSGDEWLESFTAIEWILQDKSWVFGHAEWFLGFPKLLLGATLATLVLELGAPLLLMSPLKSAPIRTFGIAGLCGLQLGIGSLMDLHLFPAVNLIVLVGLIPGWAWARLGGRVRPLESVSPVESVESVSRGSVGAWGRVRDVFVAFCLVLVVWMNASNEIEAVRMPPLLIRITHALSIFQRWQLYGPDPRRADKQVDFIGELANGELVDKDSDAGHDAWRVLRDIEGHYRYRLYTVFTLDRNFELHQELRPHYAQWICDRWNLGASTERRMQKVYLIAIVRRLRFRRPPTEPKTFGFLDYSCQAAAEATPG